MMVGKNPHIQNFIAFVSRLLIVFFLNLIVFVLLFSDTNIEEQCSKKSLMCNVAGGLSRIPASPQQQISCRCLRQLSITSTV